MADSVVVPAQTVLEFPKAMFGFEALKRSAYALMARATVAFEECPDTLRCVLTPATATEDPALLERDFRREVIDQELRLSIESQTETFRNAILGLAFSKTGLQE
jgi:His-Xaa-Ser system protein HxsD